MARATVSVADSTALLSCFVMGAELLLLFVYIRTQILVGIKRQILTLVDRELNRPDRFMGSDDPVERPGFERLHASFCADSYHSSALLATLGYVLATTALLSIVSKVRPSRTSSLDSWTAVASGAAGMVVFLASQWGFLKLAVLPFYADLYNRITGERVPRYETDSPGVTVTLLTPTLVSALVLLLVGLAGFGRIRWAAVAWTAAVSLLSLGTEVVSWFLMKGFAVPVSEIVSAITDAITAVLWVNRENPPEAAVRKLKEALFPDASVTLSAANVAKHVHRDHFGRRRLEVTGTGALVVRDAPSEPVRALVMLACTGCLLLAPFVVLALRAPALDAAVVTVQLLLIAVAYGIYTVTTGKTATMRRLTAALGAPNM